MNVWYQLIGFGALIAVVTYETPVTVLPIVASLAALLPFFQSNKRVIQAAGIVSGLSEGCTASGVVFQTLRHRRGCAAAGVAGERVAFLSAAPGGCCQRGQPPSAGDWGRILLGLLCHEMYLRSFRCRYHKTADGRFHRQN